MAASKTYDPPPDETNARRFGEPGLIDAGQQRVATWSRQSVAPQRFCHLGARFSANALGPSLASSLLKTSPEISDSIL